MMDERTSRIFIGLCLLVLVWIGVYWMWQPSGDRPSPVITFDQPVEDVGGGQALIEEQPPILPQGTPGQSSAGGSLANQLSNQSPEVTPGEPTLLPPEFLEHVVAEYETMQTISRQYYGTLAHWDVIARANPFVDPQKLRAGQTIRIPKDIDNIQGVVVGRETEPGVIESHTPNDSGFRDYVVRPGDSLSKISLNIYGTTRHARLIFDANRDALRSMDDISIGQLLRLPPLPEDEP